MLTVMLAGIAGLFLPKGIQAADKRNMMAWMYAI